MLLDDEYIPEFSKVTECNLLKKLSAKILCNLILDWYEKFGLSNRKLQHLTYEKLQLDFKYESRNKNNMSTLITKRYWPHGLNLYQLSDIDFNILLTHPSRYKWNSVTMYKSQTEKVRPSYNIPYIVKELTHQLSNYYLTYITSRHDSEQHMELIRIQFFEKSLTQLNNSKLKLLSRTPYYLVLLDDQELPIFIHTSGEDPTSQLILETFKRIIINSSPYNIRFKRNELTKESIKSLDNILISCNTSRYDNSIGRWSQYGEGNFEVSPLNNIIDHNALIGKKIRIDDIKMKSMLLFKGSSTYLNGYNSIDPIPRVSFQYRDPNDNITVGFKFHGLDVFGGLHKLCDEGLMNIDKIPGWLTGENGPYSGVIENGDFIRKSRKP